MCTLPILLKNLTHCFVKCLVFKGAKCIIFKKKNILMSHPEKYKIRIIICMWKILLTQAILHEYYIMWVTFTSLYPTFKKGNLESNKANNEILGFKYYISRMTFLALMYPEKNLKKVLVMQFSMNKCVFLAVLLLNLICTMFNVTS